MAAADCIPVNISNGNTEAEELKKMKENGVANGNGTEVTNGCHDNGKEQEGSPAEDIAPESTTESSNPTPPEQQEDSTGNTGDEECCEEEPAVSTEEIGAYDERMNGHSKKTEEVVPETTEAEACDGEGDGEAEDGVTTKRPADDGECLDEPVKKFYEGEEPQATSE